MPDASIPALPPAYRRPALPLHRAPSAGHLLTIREAIEAGHPDEDVLETIEALANSPSLDEHQTELRARLIATAADVAQGWFDGADERALGDAADLAYARRMDL